MIYLHAKIQVRPGHMQDMLTLLREEVKPRMEQQGWTMLGCWQALTGPRNVIVDLWEIEDLEQFRSVYASLNSSPDRRPDDLRSRLDRWVERETLTVLERRI